MELSPVPIGIGPGPGGGACYRVLRRIPIPRTPVNKDWAVLAVDRGVRSDQPW